MATPTTYQIWMILRFNMAAKKVSNHRSSIRAKRLAAAMNRMRIEPKTFVFTVRKS